VTPAAIACIDWLYPLLYPADSACLFALLPALSIHLSVLYILPRLDPYFLEGFSLDPQSRLPCAKVPLLYDS